MTRKRSGPGQRESTFRVPIASKMLPKSKQSANQKAQLTLLDMNEAKRAKTALRMGLDLSQGLLPADEDINHLADLADEYVRLHSVPCKQCGSLISSFPS